MLAKCPFLTRHVIERAEERLGLNEDAFRQWVRATYQGWAAVTAGFLGSRNIQFTGNPVAFYATPFTSERGVVFLMRIANDNRNLLVVTLVDYWEANGPKMAVSEYADINASLRPIERIGLKLARDGFLDKFSLPRLLNLENLYTDTMTYVMAYADSYITYKHLMEIMEADPAIRQKLFRRILQDQGMNSCEVVPDTEGLEELMVEEATPEQA